MEDILAASYATGFTLIVLLAVFAMFYAYYEQKRRAVTKEHFLTARGTQAMWRVAWSFFAGSLGAWVLFGPAPYATYSGYIGVITYAVSSGFPIMIIGWVGPYVQTKAPNILSLSDYVGKRFGKLTQFYVFLLMCFNMGIGLTAEFTAIGDVFEYLVGTSRIPIVVTVATLTSFYTSVGGLSVSMVTDQLQGIFVLLAVFIFSIYIAVNFRLAGYDLTDDLGPNYYGYSSIAVMPISLTCATIYNESFWQRVWASENPRALKLASTLAAFAVTLVVFLFGLFGLLAAWNQLPLPSDNSNLALFAILGDNAPKWIWVLLICLGTVMNESAVDSVQNGLVNVISSVLIKRNDKKSITATRLLVFLLNLPCVIVSLSGLSVISLFLVANLISTTSSIPILFGLIDKLKPYHNHFSCLLGCIGSFLAVFGYGVNQANGNPNDGAYYVFYSCFCYEPFLIALFVSFGCTLLGIFINYILVKLNILTYTPPDEESPNSSLVKDHDFLTLPNTEEEEGGKGGGGGGRGAELEGHGEDEDGKKLLVPRSASGVVNLTVLPSSSSGVARNSPIQ